MTTADFMHTVEQWIATARDPRFKRAYTDLVYQPMLELMAYLRSRGFSVYIVSGGEAEFMPRGPNASTACRRSTSSAAESRCATKNAQADRCSSRLPKSI